MLETIAATPTGLEIGDIADSLGLSPSTAYRLVGVLQRRDELQAPVYLTDFRGGEIVVSHIADSPEHPRIGQLHVGFSEANHATAFGKLMLAAMDVGALDDFLERTERRALTRQSITSSTGIRGELARVRRKQLAIEVEEYMPLLACIAAPVRSARGSTIGAVSVSVTADEFRSRADQLERVVRRAAWHVASQLDSPAGHE